jgi:hypothetical protein
MRWKIHWTGRIAALALLLGTSPITAEAGFLSQYTGNTQMSGAGTSASGVIDFAVYQNPSGHNWAADLGLSSAVTGQLSGGGVVDTSANYVYFYEVVNTAPSGSGMISIFNIGNAGIPFTSGGWLRGYVFSDASNNAVGPVGNAFLGPAASGDDPFTGQPSNSGVSLGNPPFTNTDVSPTDPTGVASLGGASSMGTATFLWTILFGNALLGQNAYSPVLFYTSNSAPVYAGGSISDPSGLNPSDGGIPGQAPEPATLLIWSMGAIGCLITARHRSRKRADAVVETRLTA